MFTKKIILMDNEEADVRTSARFKTAETLLNNYYIMNKFHNVWFKVPGPNFNKFHGVWLFDAPF